MMYRLRRAFVWLRRFMHLRGNGIQSPFDYAFTCEVINNRSAYYAYDDLRQELKAMTLKQRKLARLLFRLANFCQPETIMVDSHLLELYGPFLERGCLRASIAPLTDEPVHADTAGGPVLVVSERHWHSLGQLPDGSIVSALNIRGSRADRQHWRELSARLNATLTFDLYHSGIVITLPDRYKQHYIINF